MHTDENIYKSITATAEELASEDIPAVTVMANISAILYSSFEKISWAGFYLYLRNNLYLGPFQGKPACTFININNGVCGKAARDMRTVIVEDVNRFPGHIACDSDSRSEIVVPVIFQKKLRAVIDIDSSSYSSFGKTDRKYLEEIADIISIKCGEMLF